MVGVVIALCFIFSQVPTSFTMSDIGPEVTHQIAEGSRLRQLQFGSLFLLAAWLVRRNAHTALATIRHLNPFLTLLLIYCAASMLWSTSPTITFKRVILFAGLMLIGLAISPPTGSPRQFTRAMLGTLFVLVAVSALVALALPHIGVDQLLDGAWRGITWQKNLLGSIAGFCVILWLREWLSRQLPRSWSGAGLLLSLIVLVMAKSTTALVVTTVGIGVYLLLRRKWLSNDHAGTIVTLAVLALSLLSVYLFYIVTGRLPTWQDIIAPIATLLNKSPDLTGRTEIWRLVLIAAQNHLPLGIGYGAFWIGEGGPAQFIADEFGWMPSNGHNGYIDLLNEIGIAGFSLFIGLLAWHLASILRMLSIDRDEAALHAAMLVLVIISNFSESQFLRDVSFQNIVLIFSSVTVSATLWQARRGTSC